MKLKEGQRPREGASASVLPGESPPLQTGEVARVPRGLIQKSAPPQPPPNPSSYLMNLRST